MSEAAPVKVEVGPTGVAVAELPGDVPLPEGAGNPLDGRTVAVDIRPPGFVPEGIAITLVGRAELPVL